MGEYNRHAPLLLGEEWAAIRDEDTVFSPAVDIVEIGHSFTLSQSYTLGNAKFYINDWPPGRALGQVFLANIYARGEEAHTGPIQSVIIPCNSVTVSGAAVVNATDGPEAVADPSDNSYILCTTGDKASFHFAVDSYSAQLTGKRFVDVRVHYVIAGTNSATTSTVPESGSRGLFSLANSTESQNVGYGEPDFQESLVGARVSTAYLGEIDYLWSTSSPLSTSERLPWTYAGLQKFEFTNANRMRFMFDMDVSTTDTLISYVALEVLYCEESRVAYGGRAFGAQAVTASTTKYVLGANAITVRDTARAATPTLAAGDYTMTISSANLGDAGGPSGLELRKVALSQYPALNALRELYATSAHPGVQVNTTAIVGDTFTSESTSVLPQLSLHVSSGGAIPDFHSYGRLARVPIYDTITATQEIYDNVVGGTADYPQVRFYARRFGDTVIPLTLDSPNITGTGLSVSITPAELDLLPEIIDGWREVTLTFPTAPTMGALSEPQWRWSASGESILNRWEVLGVSAPALSGIPGNLLNEVPSAQRLGNTTYGSLTAGDTVALTWKTPNITGVAEDPSTDAVLIFAQNPNAISGIAVTQETQALSSFTECTSSPCCVPTALTYNQVSWTPEQTPEHVFFDTFTRTSVDSWGTPTCGPSAYTDTGGAASDYQVNGTQGTHTLDSVVVSRKSSLGTLFDSSESTISVTVPVLATGAAIETGLMVRYVDADNYHRAVLMFGTDGYVTLNITRRVAGVEGVLDSKVIGEYSAGDTWHIRFLLEDISNGTLNSMHARAWLGGTDEPTVWQAYATYGVLLAAAGVGVYSMLLAGNTNGTVTLTYDDYSVQPETLKGFELQRYDSVTAEWQTIMKSTHTAVTSFNDYEARVGVASSYRVRSYNILDFVGAWSSEASSTIAEPGVTLPSCGTDKRGVLIFTSNESQTGAYNLAYAMTWDRNVEETFIFPETDDLVYQRFHDRDYQFVSHGTERGGEQFTRTLLLANAAVSLPRLANMRDLRDMAWADLSYVCVRDDIGDRWFASVSVPSGSARRNRRLYNAQITVTEVADVSSQVAP